MGVSYLLRAISAFVLISHLLRIFPKRPAASMSSPSSTHGAFREISRPTPVMMSPRQTSPTLAKKVPLSPPKNLPSCLKATANKKQNYSPSLVQFSYQQKRPRFDLNLFSIIRLTLVVATIAGIPLSVLQARSRESAFLHSSVLKLVFVRDFTINLLKDLYELTFLEKAGILSCALVPGSRRIPL
jgi:hypothetical protein